MTPDPEPLSVSSLESEELEPNKELFDCAWRFVIPTIAGERSSTISEILEESSLLNADELLELDELF